MTKLWVLTRRLGWSSPEGLTRITSLCSSQHLSVYAASYLKLLSFKSANIVSRRLHAALSKWRAALWLPQASNQYPGQSFPLILGFSLLLPLQLYVRQWFDWCHIGLWTSASGCLERSFASPQFFHIGKKSNTQHAVAITAHRQSQEGGLPSRCSFL